MADLNQKALLEIDLNVASVNQNAASAKSNIKALTVEMKALKDAGKENEVEYIAMQGQMKAYQQTVNQAVQVNKQLTIAQNSQKGSLDEQKATLALVTREYNSLSESERNLTNVGGKLLTHQKGLSDSLKDLEGKGGNFSRSVGGYTDAINAANVGQKSLSDTVRSTVQGFGFLPGVVSDSAGKLTSFVQTQRSVIQGFQTIKQLQVEAAAATAASVEATEADTAAQAQLAAGTITEAEAAAVAAAALEAQTTATIATAEATEATTGALGLLKIALISTGFGAAIVLLGTLVTYFNNTNEGAKKVKVIFAEIGAVVQTSLKTLGSYGKVIYDILSGNFSQISEDLGKANDNLKNIVKNSVDAAKSAGAVTVERQKLTKAEREFSEVKAKQRGDVGLLTKQLRDQNLSEKERLALGEKAKSIREQTFQGELALAKQNQALVEKEQSLNSKKDYQAITDAKNRVQELINAKDEEVQGITNKESKLTSKLAQEQKARESAEQKAAEKRKKAKEDADKSDLVKQGSALRTDGLDNNESQRQKELDAINIDFDKKVFANKKYSATVEQLELERQATLKNLREKFAIEDAKDSNTYDNLLYKGKIDLLKANIEDIKKQKNAGSLDDQNQVLENLQKIHDLQVQKNAENEAFDLAKQGQSDEEKLIVEETYKQASIQLDSEYEQQRYDILSDFADKREARAVAEKDRIATIEKAKRDIYSEGLGFLVQVFGKQTVLGKAALVAQKALAVAEIAINTERQVSSIELRYAKLAEQVASIPFVGGFVAAALIAKGQQEAVLAFIKGGIQAGVVLATAVSGFAKGGIYTSDGKGGMLSGYSRTDNINARLRQGEGIVVSEAMQNPFARKTVSDINVAFGGRAFTASHTGQTKFATGGVFSTQFAAPINEQYINDVIQRTAATVSENIKVAVVVEEVNAAQAAKAVVVNRSNI